MSRTGESLHTGLCPRRAPDTGELVSFRTRSRTWIAVAAAPSCGGSESRRNIAGAGTPTGGLRTVVRWLGDPDRLVDLRGPEADAGTLMGRLKHRQRPGVAATSKCNGRRH